jgi:hypothetical protein
MSILGIMALRLIALLLTVSSDSLRCDARPPRGAAPYDSSNAVALAGEYELVLVTTAPRRGRRVSGRLDLTPADSVRRRTALPLTGTGPRVQGVDRPLWGTAALDGDRLFDYAPLTRLDADHPAVVLVADGRLLLKGDVGPTSSHTELRITRVSTNGFWGRWGERHALTIMVVADGRVGDEWTGYFCATRRRGA